MQTLTDPSVVPPRPSWLLGASVAGVLWNLYGIYQFAGTLTPAGQAAMTAGMTGEQARVYLSLPGWITLVFALGVFGGLAGSLGLALRRRWARAVLAASFGGYVLLFLGDAGYGVFTALPSQLGILALVVLIAAGLGFASWQADQRGLLR